MFGSARVDSGAGAAGRGTGSRSPAKAGSSQLVQANRATKAAHSMGLALCPVKLTASVYLRLNGYGIVPSPSPDGRVGWWQRTGGHAMTYALARGSQGGLTAP